MFLFSEHLHTLISLYDYQFISRNFKFWVRYLEEGMS